MDSMSDSSRDEIHLIVDAFICTTIAPHGNVLGNIIHLSQQHHLV